jgi:hypothetical protein
VSVDTAMVSSSVETIEVDDEEDDAESQARQRPPSTVTPRRAASTEE